MPVTYADVWEYWLRNREIYDAVDFVTIHILPYWEDMPIKAKFAASHVDSIRKRMAVAFPGKEILIGETGWPSQGRMREGALPSRTNQARVVSEILDTAKREGFRVNLIEAYDQPWKRQLEGTVGGYWGLFDAFRREVKYPPGDRRQQLSARGSCRWHAAWSLSVLTFLAAIADACGGGRGRRGSLPGSRWRFRRRRRDACSALPPTRCSTKATAFGGWLQWGALLAAAIASPLLCANAADVRAAAADIPRTDRAARGQDPLGADGPAWARAGGHHAGRSRNRARLRLRSALPRFSLCRR